MNDMASPYYGDEQKNNTKELFWNVVLEGKRNKEDIKRPARWNEKVIRDTEPSNIKKSRIERNFTGVIN